jgi:hypothetical protein
VSSRYPGELDAWPAIGKEAAAEQPVSSAPPRNGADWDRAAA